LADDNKNAKMQKYISQYTSYLEIEKCLSSTTIKIYRNDIVEFQRYLGDKKPIEGTTRDRIRGFLVFLTRKHNQPITRRRKLTTLRSFFEYLTNEKKIRENPTKTIALPRVAIKEPSYFTEREIKKIITQIRKDKTRFKERNLTIFKVLAETGLRIGEMVGLDIKDLDFKNKTMRVKRKGNYIQRIPIPNSLAKDLREFTKNKGFNNPVFISSFKSRITQRRVSMLLQVYIKKAGESQEGKTIHSIRHGFCSRLLDKGVNLKTIQILAGHRSIATTERYLHIAKERLRQGIEMAQI